MIERRVTQLVPTATLAAVCAVLGVAWVIEPGLAPAGWAGRLTVLLAGVTLSLLAGRLTLLQAAKASESARRHILNLCSLESHALCEQESQEAIPLRKGD